MSGVTGGDFGPVGAFHGHPPGLSSRLTPSDQAIWQAVDPRVTYSRSERHGHRPGPRGTGQRGWTKAPADFTGSKPSGKVWSRAREPEGPRMNSHPGVNEPEGSGSMVCACSLRTQQCADECQCQIIFGATTSLFVGGCCWTSHSSVCGDPVFS